MHPIRIQLVSSVGSVLSVIWISLEVTYPEYNTLRIISRFSLTSLILVFWMINCLRTPYIIVQFESRTVHPTLVIIK